MSAGSGGFGQGHVFSAVTWACERCGCAASSLSALATCPGTSLLATAEVEAEGDRLMRLIREASTT